MLLLLLINHCLFFLRHCFAVRLQVQEYFGDFMALEGHHFQVPLSRPHLAMQPFSWDFGNSSDAISRMTEGVASLMLSLRRRFHIRWVGGCGAARKAARWGREVTRSRHVAQHSCRSAVHGTVAGAPSRPGTVLSLPPCVLPPPACRRSYQRGSEICERFAQALHHLTAIEEQELFDFGSRGEAPPVLLVLDRRDDPVTPLLSQWTYQVGGRGRHACTAAGSCYCHMGSTGI